MATYYVATDGDNANDGLSEGNAFADLGYAVTQATADGDLIYVKAGTYTLTTTTPGAGGPIDMGTNALRIESYTTTPGDDTGFATIDAGAQTGITIASTGGTFGKESSIRGLIADGQLGGNGGFGGTGSHGALTRCTAIDCTNGFSALAVFDCVASGCTTVGFASSGRRSGCVAIDCTVGFDITNSQGTANCIAIDCGLGFDDAFYSCCFNCIAVGCTTGFGKSGNQSTFLAQCLAANCTTGFYGSAQWYLVDCAGYNNTSDFVGTPRTNYNFQSLGSDPFVDAANDDYTISNAASDLLNLNAGNVSTYGTFRMLRGFAEDDAGGGGSSFYNPFQNPVIR